jgi:hypothetical protein
MGENALRSSRTSLMLKRLKLSMPRFEESLVCNTKDLSLLIRSILMDLSLTMNTHAVMIRNSVYTNEDKKDREHETFLEIYSSLKLRTLVFYDWLSSRAPAY